MKNYNVFLIIDKKNPSLNQDKLNEIIKNAKKISNCWYAFVNEDISVDTNEFNNSLVDATYDGDIVLWILRDGEQRAGKRYEVQEVRGKFM